VIDLKFEPGMAAASTVGAFILPRFLLDSLRLSQNFSPLGTHTRNYHRDGRGAYYAFV
jgi:hypothetical protein